ncbi:MAG TPA: quercetin 2,3-dioxygenase, partial [Casimicrobiaceae bacterium]
YNASDKEPVHFLQIWIEPDRRGVAPSYEQKHFPDAEKRGRLRLIASPDGNDGSVSIHQDARMYAGLFDGDESARLDLAPDRVGYVHVARGSVDVNGHRLSAGDAITADRGIALRDGRAAEVLVFALPADWRP